MHTDAAFYKPAIISVTKRNRKKYINLRLIVATISVKVAAVISAPCIQAVGLVRLQLTSNL